MVIVHGQSKLLQVSDILQIQPSMTYLVDCEEKQGCSQACSEQPRRNPGDGGAFAGEPTGTLADFPQSPDPLDQGWQTGKPAEQERKQTESQAADGSFTRRHGGRSPVARKVETAFIMDRA
jgi:hypothetical protein